MVRLLCRAQRGRLIPSGCAFALILLGAGRAAAEPEVHDGLFLRFASDVGAGLLTIHPDDEATPDIDVSAVQFGARVLAGGSLVPGMVLGGGVFFTHAPAPTPSSADGDLAFDGTMISYGVLGFANYHFDPASGLHVQGFVGMGVVDLLSTEEPDDAFNGPLVGLGVGYDFWLGDEWSIGPFGRLSYAVLGGDVASARFLSPSIGGALTYH